MHEFDKVKKSDIKNYKTEVVVDSIPKSVSVKVESTSSVIKQSGDFHTVIIGGQEGVWGEPCASSPIVTVPTGIEHTLRHRCES